MVKIVLVRPSVPCLDHIQRDEFRENELQKPAAVQIDKALAGCRCHHDFVQFLLDAFPADDSDPVGIAFQGLEGFILNEEIELCGKAHAPHHTQRVVRKGNVRGERRTDNAVPKVVDTAERVDELAEAFSVQADGQRIDGEVAAILVVLQRTVLHDRLPAVVAVPLRPCPDELHLRVLILHLCRTKITEDGLMCLLPQNGLQLACHLNTASHDHHVNIIRRTFQEQVAHITAYHIAFKAQFVGRT